MFIFTLLCGASKGFETPQKSVKMKIQLIFSLPPGSGRERLIKGTLMQI